MDRIPASSPWHGYVSVDPDRLGGEPVFRGTRVPVKALFDYLKGGYDLATFLDHFEGVGREQAEKLLERAEGSMSFQLRAA